MNRIKITLGLCVIILIIGLSFCLAGPFGLFGGCSNGTCTVNSMPAPKPKPPTPAPTPILKPEPFPNNLILLPHTMKADVGPTEVIKNDLLGCDCKNCVCVNCKCANCKCVECPGLIITHHFQWAIKQMTEGKTTRNESWPDGEYMYIDNYTNKKPDIDQIKGTPKANELPLVGIWEVIERPVKQSYLKVEAPVAIPTDSPAVSTQDCDTYQERVGFFRRMFGRR